MSVDDVVVPLGPKNQEDLYVVDARSRHVVRQLTHGGFGAGAPALSGDRETVFFADQSGVVFSVAANGGDVVVLLRTSDDCPFVRHLSVARDQPRRLLLQCRPLPVGGVYNLHDKLLIVDLNGVVVRTLSPTTSRVDDPTLSPDGNRVAYWGSRDLTSATNGGSLFTITTDGSDVVEQLTRSAPDVDADPAWSHDGSRLAFRRREEGKTSVYVVVPGEDPKPLLKDAANYEKPTWSPDGKEIVTVMSTQPRNARNRRYTLAVTTVETGQTVRMKTKYESIFAPAWDAR